MKKLFLLISFACLSMSTFAQEAVQEEAPAKPLVTDSYARNSISIITVDRDCPDDNIVFDCVKAINYGAKFDKNLIKTERILIEKERDLPVTKSQVDSVMLESKIGNEIIKFWFDNDNDGCMDGDLVAERGIFNADDQDVNDAASVKIGESELADAGYGLLNSSYILVLDYSKFTKEKFSEEKDTYGVDVFATVYKVDFPEDLQNEFYDKCWVEEGASAEEIAEKNEALKAMEFKIVSVTAASAHGTAIVEKSKDGKQAAVSSAYSSVLAKLENSISGWQVTVPVYKVKPISAKIGTKEGLKNTARYMAYETRKDKEGNVYTKEAGFVRATKVANNIAVATGDSPMSEFYQISKVKNIEAGQILKQSNDLGMGIGAGFATGMSTLRVTVDYLASMTTAGASTYGLMEYGMATDTGDYAAMQVGIGAGYGVRATRFIEIMPHVMGVGDYLQSGDSIGDSTDTTKEEMMEQIGWFARAGVKVNFTLSYPLQLFAGVDYSLLVSEGETYAGWKAAANREDNYFGITFGVKWIF